MKKTVIIILFFLSTLATYGATYYVSASGSNNNNGLSTGTPWQTLEKVNSTSFSAGDFIRFRCGDVFRGQLTVSASGSSGNHITYSSYGSGVKPVISGAINESGTGNWSNYSGNVWRTVSAVSSSSLNDAANVIFNNDASCGVKRTTLAGCTSQGAWYYDDTDDRVYMYSASNPGTYYSSIEVGGVYSENVLNILYWNYITIDGLSVKYSANNAIIIRANHDVVVQNCEVAWAGGMYYGVDGNGYRMGNGIQMWENVSNVTVRYNNVHDIYDAGISPQGNGSYTQANIDMHHNIFARCYYTYEFFVGGVSARTLTNVLFNNNTCISASSWSENQRPDTGNATHIKTWSETNATRTNLTIKNNIFYLSNNTGFTHYYTNVFDCDYNLFYLTHIGFINTTYYDNLASWRAATSDDYHSVSTNPLLNSDYSLQSGSPAIDAGISLSYTTDYLGNAISGVPDIGAIEYQAAVTKYANLVIEGHSFVAPGTWPGDVYLAAQTNTYAVYNSGQANSHIVDAGYPNVEARAATVDGHLVTETNALKNILVLWIGCNDMSSIVDEGIHTYQELKDYVMDRVSAGWKVFAFTITPTNAYGRGAVFETNRQYVNNMMRTDLETITGVKVLNTDALIQLDNPSNTTFYSDGLHLTQTGSALACALFGDAMTDYWLGEPIPEPPVTPADHGTGYIKKGNRRFTVTRNGVTRYVVKYGTN